MPLVITPTAAEAAPRCRSQPRQARARRLSSSATFAVSGRFAVACQRYLRFAGAFAAKCVSCFTTTACPLKKSYSDDYINIADWRRCRRFHACEESSGRVGVDGKSILRSFMPPCRVSRLRPAAVFSGLVTLKVEASSLMLPRPRPTLALKAVRSRAVTARHRRKYGDDCGSLGRYRSFADTGAPRAPAPHRRSD